MNTPKPLPPRDLVLSLLSYDPHTGICRPKLIRPGPQSNRGAIMINGKNYLIYRIIWLMYYGEPIPNEIDHKDGDRFNNRIDNLRAATHTQNLNNVKKYRNNTTGIKGVYMQNGRYKAAIGFNNKLIHLGYFDTLEEAIKARQDATIKLHGKFGNHG